VAASLARRLPVGVVGLGDPAVLSPLLHGRGFTFWVVPDAAGVLAHYRQLTPDVVVFDTTAFPDEPFAEMRRDAMVVSLSPAFNLQGHVDLVFHRTRCLTRDLTGLGPGVAVRRGLDYVVLRETCHPIPEEAYARNLDRNPLAVAISMGGVDAGNNTLQLLSSVVQIPTPMLLWVLLGEGYAHSYQALADCASRNIRHEVILAKTTDSLWRVLETCSVALLAGGITSYEAAYAGLPTINLLQNDLGPPLVEELAERGVGLAVGPPFASALLRVNAELSRLEKARGELLAMHRRSHGLIDGRGAERIATEIEAFYRDEYLPARIERAKAA
jgi:spore coat polysaccharide biosynthesis predicted glycosyltransferase SpsG